MLCCTLANISVHIYQRKSVVLLLLDQTQYCLRIFQTLPVPCSYPCTVLFQNAAHMTSHISVKNEKYWVGKDRLRKAKERKNSDKENRGCENISDKITK